MDNPILLVECADSGCGTNFAKATRLPRYIVEHCCVEKCPQFPNGANGSLNWHSFKTTGTRWAFCSNCSQHYLRELARRELPVIEEDPEGLPL